MECHKDQLSVTFLVAINIIEWYESFPKPVPYITFVDDCIFFITRKNLNTSQQILQNCLDKLQDYAQHTGFKFSKSKTTVTIFSRERKTQNHKL